MNEIPLPGCTPTPLASYLKGLAVLRLVAEQGGDPAVTGCWRNDEFVLWSRLSKDDLLRFFLEIYQPTPLVAPWGARSGFYVRSPEKAAREALDAIINSSIPRLATYRESIRVVRELLKLHGFREKASAEDKLQLLNICRSHFPEHLIAWLDACYVLTAEGRKFPPLLGTGGNEGSGSYVSGFARQVVACIVHRRYDSALESALLGSVAPESHSDQTPGHFSPQGLGGYNATNGFEADLLTNPWDYLFALEGTLIFASNATRRNDASAPQVSFPFAVAPLAAGSAGYVLDEENPKQAKRQVMELWLPIWSSPCGLDELKALFSEGRATLGRRAAATGLDFARAISSLGVDRGISAFQRFAFLMRNGQSFFAAPIERYPVRRNPKADLISDLDQFGWLWRVQRYARNNKAPNAFRAAAAQVDAALFALTQRADRTAIQKVLRQLGKIEALCATSAKTRETVDPVPRLSSRWATEANDGSTEFRIAAALAGLSLRGEPDGRRVQLTLRAHLAPVTLDNRGWDENSYLVCWGPGPLERNLAAVLHRRRLEAVRFGGEREALHSHTGTNLHDVRGFFERATDDRRIAELIAGLVCADLGALKTPEGETIGMPVPVAYILLKPVFTPESTLRYLSWLPPDRTLPMPPEVPALLAANDVTRALQLVWQRYRALGVRLPGKNPPWTAGFDGLRLLAALTIPLTLGETRRLLSWLDFSPEVQTDIAQELSENIV